MSFIVKQGEQAPFEIDLRQGSGRPYDLTGKDIIAQMKINNTTTNVTCTISGNPILGIIIFTLTDVQTAQLKVGDLPMAIFVGTYAAPPVITPATDITDKIFNIANQVTVEKGAI